jgi:branched-chain amino acid transport system permease protein
VVLLKNLASTYVDRWIMLLGFVYVFIVMYVPGGIVAGLARAADRLQRSRTAPHPGPASAEASEVPQ